jgi:hypothetical protein
VRALRGSGGSPGYESPLAEASLTYSLCKRSKRRSHSLCVASCLSVSSGAPVPSESFGKLPAFLSHGACRRIAAKRHTGSVGVAGHIPMTVRLAAAIHEHRHWHGSRVLCSDDGSPLTQREVQGFARRAARRANLRNMGVHVLRHTFCSHLAMRSAPSRSIQELAGHSELGTTQRYMHLSPAATESAIRLLDRPRGNSCHDR